MSRFHSREPADNHFGLSYGAIIGIYATAIPVGLGLLVFVVFKIARKMGWLKRSPMAILHLQGGVGGARPPTTAPATTQRPARTTTRDKFAPEPGRELSIAEELKEMPKSEHDLKP
ncbi:hypothetical protein BDV96DRAFT_608044 [Lophiotrema nucula]|uniref:Uncharacterized protein n=1 Tax=Lophiotrema nucula TaxID=690887 RepID=A0A6A5YH16_9PLEO|nr:hypothetical protein BDV96DRAFT_608044 [Lophiotrema nucula]